MKCHGFTRIPLRRETLATRKLRARLARERQGPDGKWETNQKKKEVRLVKRRCKKLNNAFDAVRSKRLADEALAPGLAKELNSELGAITKAESLKGLMPRLESLAVTPALLVQSPSILDTLVSAVKRCKIGKDDKVFRSTVLDLANKWQAIKRKSKPKHRMSSKRAAPSESAIVVSESGPPASQTSNAPPSQPRFITPVRPVKSQPTMKLGKLFTEMRAKNAVQECEALGRAKKLTIDLDNCGNASTLRGLIPHLEGLLVTPRILKESPSILQALESAAKRCRKSKDESIIRLLRRWRDKRDQEDSRPQPIKDEDAQLVSIRSEAATSSQSMVAVAPIVRPTGLKQPRITAFLGNAVTTAGG